MKRLIVLTILVTIAISTTGCRRGLRSWGIRGDRCVAPTYTPVPAYPARAYPPVAYPPVAYPPVACPPVACPPVSAPAYDVCPTVPYNGGYGGVIDGGVMDGGIIGTPSSTTDGGSGAAFQTPTLPYEGAGAYPMKRFNPTIVNPLGLPGGNPGIDVSNQVDANRPIFSHVIGDRKLQPGETLKGAYELPVESAAAPASDKK